MQTRSGFTLIEVLVVLGILAIIVPVFLTLSAYTANLNNEARLRTAATLLAESKSEQLLAQSEQLREQLADGVPVVAQGSEPPYAWESSVAMSDAVEGQMEIVVWVRWQYREQERSLQVATYGR